MGRPSHVRRAICTIKEPTTTAVAPLVRYGVAMPTIVLINNWSVPVRSSSRASLQTRRSERTETFTRRWSEVASAETWRSLKFQTSLWYHIPDRYDPCFEDPALASNSPRNQFKVLVQMYRALHRQGPMQLQFVDTLQLYRISRSDRTFLPLHPPCRMFGLPYQCPVCWVSNDLRIV